MTTTIIEFNVLKIMAEENIDQSWMVSDCTLAIRSIPGFDNVANTVIKPVNHRLADIVNGEDNSKPRHRALQYGLNLIKEQQDNLF